MSKIRSRDTVPEMKLRRALWASGLRFQVAVRLPGCPDVVFTRVRLAIFVDGCFWHGCPIHGTRPKSNVAYWSPKIEGNIARDVRTTMALVAAGWRVMRIWEHEIEDDLAEVLSRVICMRADLLHPSHAPRPR